MAAEEDITLGIGLDLSKASESIRSFANEVNNVFSGVAGKLTSALTPKGKDGISGLRAGDALGVVGLGAALQSQLNNLWEKTPSRTANAYLSVAKAQGKNPKAYAENLVRAIQRLERFDDIPTKTEDLAKAMVGHKLDPKTGLGRYGVVQHELRNFAGLLYALNAMYPGLVPRSALEDAEQQLNFNRRVGQDYRHWRTYVLNDEERKSSLQKTLNQNRLFRALANTGLLGLAVEDPDDSFIPKAETNDQITAWASQVLNIKRKVARLGSGELSRAEQRVELKELTSSLTNLTRIGKKLGGQVEYASKQIKHNTEVFAEELRGNRGDSAGRAAFALVGGKLAKDIFAAAGGMLESYWGESITRNAYASRQAYLSRFTEGGRVAGGVAGGVLGAILGSFIPGVGPVVGASVGGTVLGELGSWYGKYGETMFKSDVVSSDSMMNRIKNKAMFGNEYSTYFAKAITDSGIANGEAAMGGLADKAMSLRARMMLGQVGEQEMLYLSMMPNYYAALMAGVTGPELMRIYQQDLAAIGDPSMKYLVGQAIGNTEAFATANSPYFSSLYGRSVNRAYASEAAVGTLAGGYVAGRLTGMEQTMDKDVAAIFESARRGNELIYQGGQTSEAYQAFQDMMNKFTNKPNNITVVVNIGEDEIKRASTSDAVYMDDLQLYTVGG